MAAKNINHNVRGRVAHFDGLFFYVDSEVEFKVCASAVLARGLCVCVSGSSARTKNRGKCQVCLH